MTYDAVGLDSRYRFLGLLSGVGRRVLVGNGKDVNGVDYLAGTAAAYLLMVAGVAIMAWLEHDND